MISEFFVIIFKSPKPWLPLVSCVNFEYYFMHHFVCHQEFPILCQTCLGDNPYIRMVSHISHFLYVIITPVEFKDHIVILFS